jgi:hypothetical protein
MVDHENDVCEFDIDCLIRTDLSRKAILGLSLECLIVSSTAER